MVIVDIIAVGKDPIELLQVLCNWLVPCQSAAGPAESALAFRLVPAHKLDTGHSVSPPSAFPLGSGCTLKVPSLAACEKRFSQQSIVFCVSVQLSMLSKYIMLLIIGAPTKGPIPGIVKSQPRVTSSPSHQEPVGGLL